MLQPVKYCHEQVIIQFNACCRRRLCLRGVSWRLSLLVLLSGWAVLLPVLGRSSIRTVDLPPCGSNVKTLNIVAR